MAESDAPIQLEWKDTGMQNPVGYETIQHYLETPSETPDKTAAKLTSYFTLENCQLPGTDGRNPVALLDSIYGGCFSVVEQIPWEHSWHDRLVSLLAALQRLPKPPAEVSEYWCARRPLAWTEINWKALPGLATVEGEIMHWKPPSEYNQRSEEMRVRYPSWTVAQWTSFNRFLALFVARGLADNDEALREWVPKEGVELLRYVLELPRTDHGLEIHLPSAAVWFLTASEWFRRNFGLEINTRDIKVRGPSAEADIKYHGPDGINEERWQFWKTAFAELAESGRLSEVGKAMASRAALYAEEIWREE